LSSGGLGRIVVGFVKADYGGRISHGANINAGQCVSCGRDTYFNPSGAAAVRARDAQPICQRCQHIHGDEILRREI
jgi:hypothetical protein